MTNRKVCMLTERDVQQLDQIMASVAKRRMERIYPPDRDEEKIAEILQEWETSSEEQHQLLLMSQWLYAEPVQLPVDVKKESTLKSYRWKSRKDNS